MQPTFKYINYFKNLYIEHLFVLGIVLVFGDTVAYKTALWNLIFRNIIMIIKNPVRYEVDITGLGLHMKKLRHRNLFLQVTSVAGTHQFYWCRQDDRAVLIIAAAELNCA